MSSSSQKHPVRVIDAYSIKPITKRLCTRLRRSREAGSWWWKITGLKAASATPF